MPTTWQDTMDSEAYTEAYGEGEAYGDEDSYGDAEAYGEETRAERERRRRARIALARRRAAERRRPQPVVAPTPGPSPRQAINAVRDLDLETKVTEDALRGRLSGQGRRMTRAEYAAAASTVTEQIFDSFGGPTNTYLRAGLRFAPLLLLAPQRRGTGLESIITDPRVVAAAAIAGVAFFGDNHKKATAPRRIQVQARDTLDLSTTGLAVATVTDNAGNPLDATLTWSTSDPNIATVAPLNATTARITPNDVGDVVVTATAGTISAGTIVTVVDSSINTGSGGGSPAPGGGSPVSGGGSPVSGNPGPATTPTTTTAPGRRTGRTAATQGRTAGGARTRPAKATAGSGT